MGRGFSGAGGFRVKVRLGFSRHCLLPSAVGTKETAIINSSQNFQLCAFHPTSIKQSLWAHFGREMMQNEFETATFLNNQPNLSNIFF